MPVLRGDALQQAARQGDARLPGLRSPLPAPGVDPDRAARRPRHVGRAGRRPAVGRRARLRRPEGVPGPADRGADRDRDARRGRVGHGRHRSHRGRAVRHGLRVHGRFDGGRGRGEGDACRRARARRPDPARGRVVVRRGPDAGGHVRPDAAREDAGRDRTAARRGRAVHQRAHRPDDRWRLRVVCRGRRRERGRAERAHRVRRRARQRGHDLAGAAARLPALRVPVQPRVRGPRRRAPRPPRRAGPPAALAAAGRSRPRQRRARYAAWPARRSGRCRS